MTQESHSRTTFGWSSLTTDNDSSKRTAPCPGNRYGASHPASRRVSGAPRPHPARPGAASRAPAPSSAPGARALGHPGVRLAWQVPGPGYPVTPCDPGKTGIIVSFGCVPAQSGQESWILPPCGKAAFPARPVRLDQAWAARTTPPARAAINDDRHQAAPPGSAAGQPGSPLG